MSSLTNKVPFGLRIADNEFTDVYDVPNGKQCGCVCPSCHTPLEAKQGDINSWHFSHASKNVYQQTKGECEYSFYSSVRLMARQIIDKQITISLPECTGEIGYYEGIRWFLQHKKFTVTKEQDITLDNLEVEKSFSGVAVDIIGKIQKFQFVIYFSHPGRTVPDILFAPKNTQCGIIQISLDVLQTQFEKNKSKGIPYQQILTDFLINDRNSKKWIYHPRFKHCAEEALADLNRNRNIIEYKIINQSNNSHITQTEFSGLETNQQNKVVKFECVVCKNTWEAFESGGNYCPECKTHLYSRRIGEATK